MDEVLHRLLETSESITTSMNKLSEDSIRFHTRHNKRRRAHTQAWTPSLRYDLDPSQKTEESNAVTGMDNESSPQEQPGDNSNNPRKPEAQKWCKYKKSGKLSQPYPSIWQKPAVEAAPVITPVKEVATLPLPLYKVYQNQIIHAILWYMDSEDGWHSKVNPEGDNNMNCRAYIQILRPGPPGNENNVHWLYSSPTRALKEVQSNTENGWSAWKNAENDRPLRDHRRRFNGAGFRNFPYATTLHRDMLALCCQDTSVSKFYHDRETLSKLKEEVGLEAVLNFLSQDKPSIRDYASSVSRLTGHAR